MPVALIIIVSIVLAIIAFYLIFKSATIAKKIRENVVFNYSSSTSTRIVNGLGPTIKGSGKMSSRKIASSAFWGISQVISNMPVDVRIMHVVSEKDALYVIEADDNLLNQFDVTIQPESNRVILVMKPGTIITSLKISATLYIDTTKLRSIKNKNIGDVSCIDLSKLSLKEIVNQSLGDIYVGQVSISEDCVIENSGTGSTMIEGLTACNIIGTNQSTGSLRIRTITATAKVTMTNDGTGDVIVTTCNANKCALYNNGSGDMTCSNLHAPTTCISNDGTGDVKIVHCTATECVINNDSTGGVDVKSLIATSVNISSAATGDIVLHQLEADELNARNLGVGDIKVKKAILKKPATIYRP